MPRRVRVVLAELRCGPANAGVVIDREGDVWLCPDLEFEDGALLVDHRPVAGGHGEHTLVGGRLPAGAVSAEVVAAAGDRVACLTGQGAWVTVLAQPRQARRGTDPVLYRDADGAVVAPALPADWTREPIPDAEAPCPACDGSPAWDLVTPRDGTRTTDGGQPEVIAVCRACGHEEWIGSPASAASDPPAASEVVSGVAGRGPALDAVAFPVFAAADRPARVVASFATGSGETASVTVAHDGAPDLRVTTALSGPADAELGAAEQARLALADLLYENPPVRPGASPASWVLGVRAAAARASRAARLAGVRGLPISLDGSSVAFAVVGRDAHWAAVARADGRVITIAASDLAPEDLRLRALEDLPDRV